MMVGQDLKLIGVKTSHRFRCGSKRSPDELTALKIRRELDCSGSSRVARGPAIYP